MLEQRKLPEISEAAPGLRWGLVVGLPVSVGKMGSVCAEIAHRARAGRPGYVCVANVHMLVTARRDPGFRAVLDRAAIVVSDGAPLAWSLRRQGFADAEQVRGPDLMPHLCKKAARTGIPVYFYGGSEALIAELRDKLHHLIPGLDIAGAEAAPMLPARPEIDQDTLARIKASGARIVFVSLGCPKQEYWMHAYSPHLDAVLIGVGQAFNIATGDTVEAPGWMRSHGLEWLFRLMSEPRRLWRRYLVTNSLFAAYLLIETATRLWRSGRTQAGRRSA